MLKHPEMNIQIRTKVYIYIREACLFVCLFVCSDLEARLQDGFYPNLAWALWETSKYFFGFIPPRGGIILEKLKNPNFPQMAQDGGRNGIFLRYLLQHLLSIFLHFFKFGYF